MHYGISKCTENGSYSTNTVYFGVMLCLTLIPTAKREKNIPIIWFYIYDGKERGVTETPTMHLLLAGQVKHKYNTN